MRDELGRPLYFVSISKDITARKAAEQALRESEARLQTVFESLPFDLWVCDTNGRFVMQNPVAIANWGYQIGKLPAETLISGDVVELWERNNMKALTGELVAAEAQFTHHGRIVHLYTIVAPIWRDGEIMGVLGLNIDVTDRKTLQQQLLQSQKLESIGTLAGGIAHDFNNILGIIMGHAAILPDISHDGPKLARSVASIQKAGNRGAGLVRQILTFARKADVVFEPVSLNEVAAELARMFEETFPRTINIVLELDAGLPAIQADKTQVHQTILNLCVNARDAMQNGGTLTINTRLARPSEVAGHPPMTYACLTVGDTGTGMDEETKSRIFEPFFTTKELGKGTGLGLSVVYGIMESHHGFITIDSALGNGTRFLLYFPGKEDIPGREEPPAAALLAESRGTETLLIVEDEDLLCELLKSSLESAGYTVLSASDGEQALSIFRSLADDIALVVTDIGLPRMSGRDLFIALRAIRPELKVIIATGYIEPEAKTELLALGACGFLQKPYLPSQVAHSVREALKPVTVR
jgi:PAS domain S-box-containing protein